MTLETLKIEFQADAAPLKGQLSDLMGSLEGFGGALDAASSRAQPAGRLAAEGFAGGLAQGEGGVRQAVSGLLNAASLSDGAAVGAANRAGAALAQGFARGISSGSGAVYSAVKRMVDQALRLIRSLLGIHSPSKVAGAFGDNFGEGFARGIAGSAARVARASEGLAGAASDGLGGALPEEVRTSGGVGAAAASAVAESLNITVPLNVDGIKLGEASIRGINAVTRSAGRMLLEI